jgi:hypothetical protein
MVQAYKDYRAFLNVNSVKNSPTMFSRRVFELLASGTPVVSTPCTGIRQVLGDDVVRMVDSESQTEQALRDLLEDEDRWGRVSALGIRRVMREHTYKQRFRFICQCAGLSVPEDQPVEVLAVAVAQEPARLSRLIADLAAQTHRPTELLVVTAGTGAANLERLAAPLTSAGVRVRSVRPQAVQRALDEARQQAVCFLNARDRYGPHYLADAVAALGYCGCPVVGKAAYFAAEGSNGDLRLRDAEQEHHRTARVRSATLLASNGTLSDEHVRQALSGEEVTLASPLAYAAHRFNYVCLAGASPSRHDAAGLEKAFV